jgi:hypothetical protein
LRHINIRHVEAPQAAILCADRLPRIIDDDGNDCTPGTPGEVLVQGPIVTKGYFNNPEADAGSFKDGFLCTGDIGFIKDGRVFIVVSMFIFCSVDSSYNAILGSEEGTYQVQRIASCSC